MLVCKLYNAFFDDIHIQAGRFILIFPENKSLYICVVDNKSRLK